MAKIQTLEETENQTHRISLWHNPNDAVSRFKECKTGNEMSYAIVGSAPPIPLPVLASPVNLKNGSLSSTAKGSNTAGGGGGSEDPNQTAKPKDNVAGYKWRLVISYDGTRYSGWQYQKSIPTIQCIVEEALTKATKLERADLCMVGASRTDRGVHALGQVAHFVTPSNFNSLENSHAALNNILPCDIQIRELCPAVPEFHARLSVKSKVYHYKIYHDAIMDPFLRLYAYHCVYQLNVDAMREAAKFFVGTHDFSAFANATRNDGVVRDPVKNIFRFDVNEMGAVLQLEVEGSGFLYKQVRNMVALLVEIGKEAIPPEIIPMILESRDRRVLAKYASVAPAHGLCLVSCNCYEEHLQLPSGWSRGSTGRHHTVTQCKLPFY